MSSARRHVNLAVSSGPNEGLADVNSPKGAKSFHSVDTSSAAGTPVRAPPTLQIDQGGNDGGSYSGLATGVASTASATSGGADPSTPPAALAALLHQTDKTGKQQRAMASPAQQSAGAASSTMMTPGGRAGGNWGKGYNTSSATPSSASSATSSAVNISINTAGAAGTPVRVGGGSADYSSSSSMSPSLQPSAAQQRANSHSSSSGGNGNGRSVPPTPPAHRGVVMAPTPVAHPRGAAAATAAATAAAGHNATAAARRQQQQQELQMSATRINGSGVGVGASSGGGAQQHLQQQQQQATAAASSTRGRSEGQGGIFSRLSRILRCCSGPDPIAPGSSSSSAGNGPPSPAPVASSAGNGGGNLYPIAGSSKSLAPLSFVDEQNGAISSNGVDYDQDEARRAERRRKRRREKRRLQEQELHAEVARHGSSGNSMRKQPSAKSEGMQQQQQADSTAVKRHQSSSSVAPGNASNKQQHPSQRAHVVGVGSAPHTRIVRRPWRRPPPPTQRINNVIRPSSTVGDGPLLGPLLACDRGRKCLVLDLDETLVHSSFRPVPNPDYILPVEIEGVIHSVYVLKRPGCDEFLYRVGQCYEVVVFTASLSKYADPLLDLLDPHNVIRARLFREACVHHEGSFVKDMSMLGRDPTDVIIVDNSPASYLFQPENALPCDSFIDDFSDRELYLLADLLESIQRVADVREALHRWVTGTYSGLQGLAVLPPEHDLYWEEEEVADDDDDEYDDDEDYDDEGGSSSGIDEDAGAAADQRGEGGLSTDGTAGNGGIVIVDEGDSSISNGIASSADGSSGSSKGDPNPSSTSSMALATDSQDPLPSSSTAGGSTASTVADNSRIDVSNGSVARNALRGDTAIPSPPNSPPPPSSGGQQQPSPGVSLPPQPVQVAGGIVALQMQHQAPPSPSNAAAASQSGAGAMPAMPPGSDAAFSPAGALHHAASASVVGFIPNLAEGKAADPASKPLARNLSKNFQEAGGSSTGSSGSSSRRKAGEGKEDADASLSARTATGSSIGGDAGGSAAAARRQASASLGKKHSSRERKESH